MKSQNKCGNCNNLFDNPRNNPRKRFCSRHCYNIDWQRRHQWRHSKKEYGKWVKAGKRIIGINTIIPCAVCHKEFIKKSPQQKYCSVRCSRDAEYFIRVYGKDWRKMKARYLLARELNQFKEEIKP